MVGWKKQIFQQKLRGFLCFIYSKNKMRRLFIKRGSVFHQQKGIVTGDSLQRTLRFLGRFPVQFSGLNCYKYLSLPVWNSLGFPSSPQHCWAPSEWTKWSTLIGRDTVLSLVEITMLLLKKPKRGISCLSMCPYSIIKAAYARKISLIRKGGLMPKSHSS